MNKAKQTIIEVLILASIITLFRFPPHFTIESTIPTINSTLPQFTLKPNGELILITYITQNTHLLLHESHINIPILLFDLIPVYLILIVYTKLNDEPTPTEDDE